MHVLRSAHMIIVFLRFFLYCHQTFHNTTKLPFQETLWQRQKLRGNEKQNFCFSLLLETLAHRII